MIARQIYTVSIQVYIAKTQSNGILKIYVFYFIQNFTWFLSQLKNINNPHLLNIYSVQDCERLPLHGLISDHNYLER